MALDGTKVKANASKHKAMSDDRMLKAEAEAERIRREPEEEQKRRQDKDAPPKPGKPPEPSEHPRDKAQRNFTEHNLLNLFRSGRFAVDSG